MREATVATPLIIDMSGYLERHGVPRAVLCEALAIEPSLLDAPNTRLPGSLVERVWATAERLTGDPDLGLHTAEAFNPGALDILGYVILSCESAADAIDRLARYAGLLNEGLRVRLEPRGDESVCRFDAVTTLDNYLLRTPRQPMEAMAAGLVTTMRRLTVPHVEPVATTFRHPAPASTTEHARILGPHVSFGAEADSVVYRTADLATPLLSANPALLAAFEPLAQESLDASDGAGTVSRQVVRMLEHRIKGIVPTLEEAAMALAMSTRSLQRKLRDEGITYQQIVDDVRSRMATRHLSKPGTTAAEVAFLLGFSEPSAFARAFRRWTGTTPGSVRRA